MVEQQETTLRLSSDLQQPKGEKPKKRKREPKNRQPNQAPKHHLEAKAPEKKQNPKAEEKRRAALLRQKAHNLLLIQPRMNEKTVGSITSTDPTVSVPYMTLSVKTAQKHVIVEMRSPSHYSLFSTAEVSEIDELIRSLKRARKVLTE